MSNDNIPFSQRLGTDLLPFVIMGIGLAMLAWLFGLGDFFIG